MIIVREPNRGLYLNTDLFNVIKTTDYDPSHAYGETLLCWGCTIPSGENFVLNGDPSYSILRNKKTFRQVISSHVRIPWTTTNLVDASDFLDKYPNEPLIGRPSYHHGGENLYVIRNKEELKSADTAGATYYSQYLPKDREVRIFVAFGRVWAVSEKNVVDKAAVAWNFAQGGRFDILRWGEWPTKACYYAILASRLTGSVVASYDFMRYQNKWYCLEGNTSTRLTGLYKQRALKQILIYHEKNPECLDLPPDKRDYSLYLHPALKDQ